MSNLPTKACWKSDDARTIIATEATEGSNKIFLSTHTPIQDFKIEGLGSAGVEANEQSLLDALAAPSTRHAFCVVQGEPGSGKSHLIRWLHIKWPEAGDLRILIQRADGSLAGTLQQLREKLPSEHQHLFDSLGHTQDITLFGRARLFHTYLAQSLSKDFYESPLPDAEWCEKFGLVELLGSQELIGEWRAPERILNVLSGKKGERNQELAQFNLDDVVELAQLLRKIRGKSVKTLRLERMLQKDAQGLQPLSKEEKLDPAREEELRRNFDTSYRLVDALNLRRNSAVQNLLGISSEGLKELFMRLRRELKERRLVLLLEDITAWEGVDNQLVDVLVTNAETREDRDLCPMVSVVGITPEYFRGAGFHTNYQQRITHHINLGEESATHQYHDVSSLRTPDAQVAFVSRYLRAVRAGVERLSKWDDSAEPVPNMCVGCVYREDCHSVFGEHEGIGLYPFIERTITTLYGALEDPEHQATYQTPRGMLLGVLAPTLLHTEVIDAGAYPGAEVESSWIPEDRQRLGGFTSDIIKAKTTSEEEAQQLRRLVAYWGSESAPQIQKSGDESLSSFDIPEGVFQSFRLPWLGGDAAPSESTVGVEEQPIPVVEQLDEAKPSTPQPPPTSGSTQPKTRQPASTIPRAQLRKLEHDIAAWGEGKRPENATELNRLTHEILQKLPWPHIGIPEWLKDKLFTQDTVILKGTKQVRVQHYVVPNEEWAYRGLEAFYALQTLTEVADSRQEEAYQRRYASMRRKLKKSVTAHTQTRLSSLSGDTSWPVSNTIAEVLFARAWLRGAISPCAELWQQWQIVLKDEEPAASNPLDRVPSWGDAVTKTGGSHSMLRELLKKWVAADGLVNPDDIPGAVAAFKATFKLSPFPSDVTNSGTQLAELSLLAQSAKETNQRLANIPNYEKDRLMRLAEELGEILRHATVREHAGRVNSVVQEVSRQLPTAAPVAVSSWAKAYQRLTDSGYLDQGIRARGRIVEAFIDACVDAPPNSVDGPASLLDWALSAPAGEIKVTHDALSEGESTIKALLSHVEHFLDDSESGHGNLETLHAIGSSITSECSLILDRVRGVNHE